MRVEGSSGVQVDSHVSLSGRRAIHLGLFTVSGDKERREMVSARFFHRNEFLY